MAAEENKIEATPAPPLPAMFSLGMDVTTWAAVHSHILVALRVTRERSEMRQRAIGVMKAIGAALVRKGALRVRDLEQIYLEEHMLRGGDYYGPAGEHVKGEPMPMVKAASA